MLSVETSLKKEEKKFNRVNQQHNANAFVMRKYKIKPNTSSNKHLDLQESGGSGQVSSMGTGLPGQP